MYIHAMPQVHVALVAMLGTSLWLECGLIVAYKESLSCNVKSICITNIYYMYVVHRCSLPRIMHCIVQYIMYVSDLYMYMYVVDGSGLLLDQSAVVLYYSHNTSSTMLYRSINFTGHVVLMAMSPNAVPCKHAYTCGYVPCAPSILQRYRAARFPHLIFIFKNS